MGGRTDLCNKVGTSFTARRWLSLNLGGLVGVACTFGVHLFALTTVTQHLIRGSFFAQIVYLLIYLPLAVFALWSLFMAWTTNPGAVPMGARPLITVRRATTTTTTSSSSSSGELEPPPAIAAAAATAPSQRSRGIRRCNKCNDNYKPNRAHHDSVTGRCIVKFDHFCPWVGNAVGAMNHKFFFLFVFYTMNTCITAIFLITLRAVRCGYTTANGDSNDDDAANEPALQAAVNATTEEEVTTTATEDESGELDEGRRWLQSMASSHYVYDGCDEYHSTYVVVVLFCVAVTFFIFTACMMAEQMEAIQTNQGKIARMKMRVGQGGTELRRVTDEFNEMFGGTSPNVAWHWFVPLPVQFPGSYHKLVLGYEWDPTFDAMPYREDETTNSSNAITADESAGPDTEPETNSMEALDVETGLTPENMDEVSLDAAETSSLTGKNRGLKKRGNSSNGDELPELT